jgi:hypothetical protein
MAKSIRSKVKKRFRTAKRVLVDASLVTDRAKCTNQLCSLIAKGMFRDTKKPSNAFKYPTAADAEFPQVILPKPMDFRSEALPTSGYATIANRRKVIPGGGMTKQVLAVDRGGSISGRLDFGEDLPVSVNHSDSRITPAIPKVQKSFPRVVSQPRRDRASRKSQRGTAK